jgi:hypothetical protein
MEVQKFPGYWQMPGKDCKEQEYEMPENNFSLEKALPCS